MTERHSGKREKNYHLMDNDSGGGGGEKEERGKRKKYIGKG